jgi:Holliday junction resolvase RusA-like endonuclease
MTPIIIFTILGEPKTCPTKGYSRYGGRYWLDEDTGLAWELWEADVKKAVKEQMETMGMTTIPKPIGYKIGFDIWITKPKSNKLPRPSCRPDQTNFTYDLENSLQKILYFDDGQRVGSIEDDLYWADKNHSPGIDIKIRRIE